MRIREIKSNSLKGFLLFCFFISCGPEKPAIIQGTLSDPLIVESLYLERTPVHYKFSEKPVYPVLPDDNGHFTFSLAPDDGREVVTLRLNGTAYPLVIHAGKVLDLNIDSRMFPMNLHAEGTDVSWNEHYQNYLNEVSQPETELENEMDAFRNAEPNRVLELYQDRISLSKKHLSKTPLEFIYYANTGEYLNRALQNVTYRQQHIPGFDADSARKAIFTYASEHDFFSLESQKAQRAGIRDFAHFYAMSFHVQDSIRAIYGDQIADQDIRRLGYDQLNRYRERVLDEIGDEAARAYAEMHFVAKRLGEMPLEVSEKSLSDYLETYPDYEEYTNFLLNFHAEMTTVEPGQPAVAFTLPDQDGAMVSMSDFDNRYVLLDFWASWCIPCLDEFPDMKRIYESTTRDQFEIIAISTEEDSLVWRRALEQFDNPWIQLYGGDGFRQETFASYRGGGIPFYILINPEGNIERYNDIRATHNLEHVLDSLLTNNPPAR